MSNKANNSMAIINGAEVLDFKQVSSEQRRELKRYKSMYITGNNIVLEKEGKLIEVPDFFIPENFFIRSVPTLLSDGTKVMPLGWMDIVSFGKHYVHLYMITGAFGFAHSFVSQKINPYGRHTQPQKVFYFVDYQKNEAFAVTEHVADDNFDPYFDFFNGSKNTLIFDRKNNEEKGTIWDGVFRQSINSSTSKIHGYSEFILKNSL